MNEFPNLPFAHLMPFPAIEEKRPTLLLTSAPAWNAVKEQLKGLNIAALLEVTEADTEHWDALQSKIENQKPEIVYAVGGGLTADAAKYIAVKLGLPLVVLPTALSVDAFLTFRIRHPAGWLCILHRNENPGNSDPGSGCHCLRPSIRPRRGYHGCDVDRDRILGLEVRS